MNEPAQAMHRTLLSKAQEDAAFRRKLIADPKDALRSLGVPLPQGVELNVVEETPSRWYLVLPPAGSGEIPDEQLDQVAGGLSYTGWTGYLSTLKLATGTGVVGPCDRPTGVVGPCNKPTGAVGPCGRPL